MALDPTDVAHRDAFHMLCGKLLGEGIARKVYASDLNADEVVKVESTAGSFQNVIEWETWQQVKDTPWARWFAPCVAISPNGSVLVMKRTKRPSVFPDRMPAFFTDFKRPNYGMRGGQIVCHDYGMNLLMQTGLTNRMKKANWWELDEE